MYRIECDTHTHTFYSRHAYSTIEENVKAAKKAGLKLLASTDHFSDMLYADYKNIKNYQYFFGVDQWPREWHKVTLLRGCEADVVDLEGHLFGHDIICPESIIGDPYGDNPTLQELVFKKVDFVIASVHSKRFAEGAGIARTTDMYLKILENPKVYFIGHIGRAGVAFDMDTVLNRVKELHKAIEINEHSFMWEGDHQELCAKIAERCAELGVKICVNTDAHIACDIGKFDRALKVLETVHFPEELIINHSRESFISGLSASGVLKKDELTATQS